MSKFHGSLAMHINRNTVGVQSVLRRVLICASSFSVPIIQPCEHAPGGVPGQHPLDAEENEAED